MEFKRGLVLLLLMLYFSSVIAQTCTTNAFYYKKGATGFWSNQANWVDFENVACKAVPGSSDTVYFSSAFYCGNVTINATETITINTLLTTSLAPSSNCLVTIIVKGTLNVVDTSGTGINVVGTLNIVLTSNANLIAQTITSYGPGEIFVNGASNVMIGSPSNDDPDSSFEFPVSFVNSSVTIQSASINFAVSSTISNANVTFTEEDFQLLTTYTGSIINIGPNTNFIATQSGTWSNSVNLNFNSGSISTPFVIPQNIPFYTSSSVVTITQGSVVVNSFIQASGPIYLYPSTTLVIPQNGLGYISNFTDIYGYGKIIQGADRKSVV